MRTVSRWYQIFLVCLIPATLPFFGGCQSLGRRGNPDLRVAPLSGQSAVALDAAQIVDLGQRAGLDEEEILKIGPHIRNAIASHGGCRIYRNKRVYMIIAVHDQRLYVSFHTGGTFIHDLDPPPPDD